MLIRRFFPSSRVRLKMHIKLLVLPDELATSETYQLKYKILSLFNLFSELQILHPPMYLQWVDRKWVNISENVRDAWSKGVESEERVPGNVGRSQRVEGTRHLQLSFGSVMIWYLNMVKLEVYWNLTNAHCYMQLIVVLT